MKEWLSYLIFLILPNHALQADWNPAQVFAPQSLLSSLCLYGTLVLGSSG